MVAHSTARSVSYRTKQNCQHEIQTRRMNHLIMFDHFAITHAHFEVTSGGRSRTSAHMYTCAHEDAMRARPLPQKCIPYVRSLFNHPGF